MQTLIIISAILLQVHSFMGNAKHDKKQRMEHITELRRWSALKLQVC